MTTAILAHYSRMLGYASGDWNMDEGAVYHAALSRNLTLCGYESDAPSRLASDRGWQFWGYDNRRCITCKRCLRILEQGESHRQTPTQLRQAVHRRNQRVKEAFDRLRDYLGEAIRHYQPDGYEEPERKAWRQIFAECAYERLRGTPSYKGFQHFTEEDWSCIESGALSRMYNEYWRPLILKGEENEKSRLHAKNMAGSTRATRG